MLEDTGEGIVKKQGLTFLLIGHPLGHSLSPVLHQTAYAALGLGHRYELAPTPDEGALQGHFEELRSGAVAGANVTIPWKKKALEWADEAEPLAKETGAANVLSALPDGRVRASNTDIAALKTELSRGKGAQCAVVLGGGGAALAAVQALRGLGIPDIYVTTRRWCGTKENGWVGAGQFRALGAKPLHWPEPTEEAWRQRLQDCGVLVQATSAGMQGAADGVEVVKRIPWERVASEMLAYDLVYNPLETPFLAAARKAGCRASGGLGMLVEQARLTMVQWLGRAPETEVLRKAALRALKS